MTFVLAACALTPSGGSAGSTPAAGLATATATRQLAAGSSPPQSTPSPSAEPSPVDANLDCRDPAETLVLRDRVDVSPDGVHILVLRPSNEPVELQSSDGPAWQASKTGPAADEFIVSLAPGEATLRCRALDDISEPGPPWVELTIVDASGVYIDPRLDCDEEDQAFGGPGYGEDATGEQADPLDLAREFAPGSEGDTFETVGYPEGNPRIVARLHDGRVVQLLEYVQDAEGGWLLDSQASCAGS